GAFVADPVDVPVDVADQQAQFAGPEPVGGENRRGVAELDGLAVSVLDHLPGRVLALALAAEQVQFARPGAGNHVADAVAVEVHELWSEADASARGHPAGGRPILEPGEGVEARVRFGAGVAVDAELALPELADEEVQGAVA